MASQKSTQSRSISLRAPIDYVAPLRVLNFPFGDGNFSVAAVNVAHDGYQVCKEKFFSYVPVKQLDMRPRSVAFVSVNRLVKGTRLTLKPLQIPGYVRQVAMVKGCMRSSQKGMGCDYLEARTDAAFFVDASKETRFFTVETTAIVVVHHFRGVRYEGAKRRPYPSERKAAGVNKTEAVPRTDSFPDEKVQPQFVLIGEVRVPISPAAPVTQAASVGEKPRIVTKGRCMRDTEKIFDAYMKRGGGFFGEDIILRDAVPYCRSTRSFVEVTNTFRWTRVWDEQTGRRGFFYMVGGECVFMAPRSRFPTISEFLTGVGPDDEVQLPDMAFYCPRLRRLVHVSEGWCWYNLPRLRSRLVSRLQLCSFYTAKEVMDMGLSKVRMLRTAKVGFYHVVSKWEIMTKNYQEKYVELSTCRPANVIAGDRVRAGNEVLASVANALNQEEVYSSVVSGIANRLALKDQSSLLAHLDNRLCEMFAQRDALIREKPNHRCDTMLKPSEKDMIKEAFPELTITFLDSVRSSHPVANAVRGCFNACFSKRCANVKFVDIGGSLTYHVKAGDVNCHVCNPVLDVKDMKRRISEMLYMTSGAGEVYKSTEILSEAAARSISYCSSPSQDCSEKCEGGYMVDVYDLGFDELGEALDAKGVMIFDLCFMLPVELLAGSGEVYLEELDTSVRRAGDKLIYSVGLCGESYTHDFARVSSYLTSAYTRTKSGTVYKVEYEGYRVGYHHLTVSRSQKSSDKETTRRMVVSSFPTKTIVMIPVLEGTYMSFKSLVLDTDFVDRVYSYALNTVSNFEMRTFEYAVGAVRSQKTHVITGTRVVHSKVEISSDDMWGLVVAIMAQAVKDRLKSLESFSIIKASNGCLVSTVNIMYRRLMKIVTSAMTGYFKGVIKDNFSVLELLVNNPKKLIVRVPRAMEVEITTVGGVVEVNTANAFSVARSKMHANFKKGRLRVFSKALVEDTIKVLGRMVDDDGKPVPVTEDAVYTKIVENLGNLHCTKSGAIITTSLASISAIRPSGSVPLLARILPAVLRLPLSRCLLAILAVDGTFRSTHPDTLSRVCDPVLDLNDPFSQCYSYSADFTSETCAGADDGSSSVVRVCAVVGLVLGGVVVAKSIWVLCKRRRPKKGGEGKKSKVVEDREKNLKEVRSRRLVLASLAVTAIVAANRVNRWSGDRAPVNHSLYQPSTAMGSYTLGALGSRSCSLIPVGVRLSRHIFWVWRAFMESRVWDVFYRDPSTYRTGIQRVLGSAMVKLRKMKAVWFTTYGGVVSVIPEQGGNSQNRSHNLKLQLNDPFGVDDGDTAFLEPEPVVVACDDSVDVWWYVSGGVTVLLSLAVVGGVLYVTYRGLRVARRVLIKAKPAVDTANERVHRWSEKGIGLVQLLAGESSRVLSATRRCTWGVSKTVCLKGAGGFSRNCRTTVDTRQVPSALLYSTLSYWVGGIYAGDLWGHVLPRHLMMFVGFAGLARVALRSGELKLLPASLWGCTLPAIVWKGLTRRQVLTQVAISTSLILRSLFTDPVPQVQVLQTIEGRNVYDEALKYYKDITPVDALVSAEGRSEGSAGTNSTGLSVSSPEYSSGASDTESIVDISCLRKEPTVGIEDVLFATTSAVEDKPVESIKAVEPMLVPEKVVSPAVVEIESLKVAPPQSSLQGKEGVQNSTVANKDKGVDVAGCGSCDRLNIFHVDGLTDKYAAGFIFHERLPGRVAVFFSRNGAPYSYNGGSHPSRGWPHVLDEIIVKCGYLPYFDHCLVQKYSAGGSIGFHADNERCYPPDNPILTVNLAGEADFKIECKNCKTQRCYAVSSDDAFVMGQGFQKRNRHAVLSKSDGRISLTFRSTIPTSLQRAPDVAPPMRGNGQGVNIEGEDKGAVGTAGGVQQKGEQKVVSLRPQNAKSEGNTRTTRKESTYTVWTAQDFVIKCDWLKADDPILALRPGTPRMAFESVATRTTEDACVEYLKYTAIGIERLYNAFISVSRIAVKDVNGALKFPAQAYEQLPGLRAYKRHDEYVYHPTEDGLRLCDIPYVFLMEKGIFCKGQSLCGGMHGDETALLCDSLLVFHDALNFCGCLKIARLGMVGKEFKSFNYVCVNAPPGGGKTTMMVEKFLEQPRTTTMVTANLGSAEDINKKLEKKLEELGLDRAATTVNSKVVNFSLRLMYDRILVDEVYMMHEGLLQFGVFASGAREGVFYGDVHQIPFINREKIFRCQHSFLKPEKSLIKYTKETYRCPLDVCFMLSNLKDSKGERCYSTGVVSGLKSPVIRSFEKRPIGSVADVVKIEADVYLCQTQAEKGEMKRELSSLGRTEPVMTVHEAQGKTFQKVVLFRTKRADDSVFNSQPHALVALSRHTTSLVYAALSSKLSDKVGSMIDSTASSTVSDALLHTFAPSGCFRGV